MHSKPFLKQSSAFNTTPSILAISTPTNSHSHTPYASTQPSPIVNHNKLQTKRKFIRVFSNQDKRQKQQNRAQHNFDLMSVLRNYLQKNGQVQGHKKKQKATDPYQTPIEKLSALDQFSHEAIEQKSRQVRRNKIFSTDKFRQNCKENRKQKSKGKIRIFSQSQIPKSCSK